MDPIAFQFGRFTVTWFGLLIAIAFMAGLWTASRRGVRDGLAPEIILDLGPWLIVGAIIGARTLYVVSYWKEKFAGAPLLDVIKVWEGGLVFYGGLFGATAAGLIHVARKQLPLWPVADALAPSISLGQVFGRIGCLMNGCCYGRPTDASWAIHFPKDHSTGGVGVHPTQIYESMLNLGLYLALAWLHRRKSFPGQVFATYLMGYALLRSVVEAFRGDYTTRYLGGIATPAHLISVGIFVIGASLFLILRTGNRRHTSPPCA